jgi:hypothetical protein
MKAIIIVGLGVSLCYSNAFAQSEAYYCTSEAAGGLSYDSAEKKWVGSIFRPDIPFVLTLQKVGDQSPERYHITITPHGERFAQPCIPVGGGTVGDNVQVYSRALVMCSSPWLITLYQFNLMNNRFASHYLLGYVDGIDNNNNTPGVSGGRCTKIE